MPNLQDFTNSKPLVMAQKKSIPVEQLLVWVFVPYRMTERGAESPYGKGIAMYKQELVNVFETLGIQWEWKPITFENLENTVDELEALQHKCIPVVLNYCIGDEDPNYPGTQVYKLLEKRGIPSTGASAASIELCTSKIQMKQAFIKAGVPTAPYEIIDNNNIAGVCDRLCTPLIVKPAMTFGSRGLSLQSVVHSDEQIVSQVQRLREGQYGVQFLQGNIFVEQFINGSEFTVLLVGSNYQPKDIKIYPPVERIFHSSLPETERFLSHDRYWGDNEGEISFSAQEPFVTHRLVKADVYERLFELSRQAYCAVGGQGCARLDIRMDNLSQELYVLEVNPNPGISSKPLSTFSDPNETPVGSILQLSNSSFIQFIVELISEALLRQAVESGKT